MRWGSCATRRKGAINVFTTCFLLSLSLSLSLCVAAPSSAQPPPPPPPTTFTITLGWLEPFLGANIIGGTKFPWLDRFGTMVQTLRQSFTVNAYPLVDATSITVKINGKTATVIHDPAYPASAINRGRWQYLNSADPVVVPDIAARFTFTTSVSKPGCTITFTVPGSETGMLNVLKVVPGVIVNPDNDFVNVGQDLVYNSSPPRLAGHPLATSNNPTRVIRNAFDVRGPSETGGDFTGITVGIIQTYCEESTFAHKAYTEDSAPFRGGTRISYPKTPLPWWDGDISLPLYYDLASRKIWNTWTGTMSSSGGIWTWTAPELEVEDTPSTGLSPQQDPIPTFSWGFPLNGLRYMHWATSPTRIDIIEDMLCATSQHVPHVYVPIKGYSLWSVNFFGVWDPSASVWYGGSVMRADFLSARPPVTDVSRGPAIDKFGYWFTIP